MFLFILENLGTSELLLIGIVALILLGPRRLPEMARKIGKLIAEFKGTAAEFKETWSREVDFEAEKKAFDFKDLVNDPVPRADATPALPAAAPMITTVENAPVPPAASPEPSVADTSTGGDSQTAAQTKNDKRNWL